MKNILIVDDDVFIGNLLEETLSQKGYSVTKAYSGTEALLLLPSYQPDLILLDLILPGLSGEEVLEQIKNIPVIVISAKSGIDNKVGLLLGGAVDYVTKPFDMKELLARIVVGLRNSNPTENTVLTFSGIRLDTLLHTVTIGERETKLTRTEFAILKLLMLTPTQVVTKNLLLDRISQDTPDCTESSLKTHISHLRSKLREATGIDYIEAVWGIGFKMKC
ncbi:MAG: response regulator transcription factor [Christensenella sp.]|nr:response regulator transcription factor [Christensenella sp.]